MRISSVWFLVGTIFLLMGCSHKDEQNAGSIATATFVVDPVTVNVTDLATHGIFQGTPTAREFQFTACIKDVGVLQAVAGTDFKISNGSQVIATPTTDASGCLHWSERVDFQPADCEAFFESSRTIEATSVHNGRVEIPIAINPWRKDKDSFRDLRTQPRPAGLRRQGSQPCATPTSTLVIDGINVDLDLRRLGNKTEAQWRLSFNPRIERIARDNSPVSEQLNKGKLTIRAQLFASNGAKSYPISSVVTIDGAEILHGIVRAEKTGVKLKPYPPREALIEMKLEISTIDGPPGIQPAHGKLVIGRFTNNILSVSSYFVPTEHLPFHEVQDSPAPEQDNPPAQASFEMGKVRAEGIDVTELDGIGKPKAVVFRLVACLKNTISTESILSDTFSITMDGQTEIKNIDPYDGCLHWPRKIEFDYNSMQNPIRKEVQVKSLSGAYAGESITRAIYLLPWKTDAVNDAVLDEKIDGIPTQTAADQAAKPELLLTEASYKFKGRTFSIDSRLNLSTTRTYRFSLRPEIRRMSRNQGWLPPEGVGNGRFQVRFLVESLDVDNPRVIDTQTVNAESLNGLINLDVDFTVHDLQDVMGRTNLSIEVLPRDRTVGVQTCPFSDTFLFAKSGSLALTPRPTSISELMPLDKRGNQPPMGGEDFAKAFHLTVLGPDKLKKIALSLAEADALATGADRSLARFCGLFHESRFLSFFTSYAACLRRPEAYLSLARTEHVRNWKGAKLLRPPETGSITMAASLSIATSEYHDFSDSFSSSFGGDVNAGFSIPLLQLVGVNVGIGTRYGKTWTKTESRTRSIGSTKRQGIDVSKSLGFDEITFELSALVDRCLIVSAKGAKPDGPRRFFYCASTPQEKQAHETYFFLYSKLSDSALQDSDASANEQPFLALVRGPERFRAFAQALNDANNVIEIGRSPPVPADVLRASKNAYDGLFPGLLTPAN